MPSLEPVWAVITLKTYSLETEQAMKLFSGAYASEEDRKCSLKTLPIYYSTVSGLFKYYSSVRPYLENYSDCRWCLIIG